MMDTHWRSYSSRALATATTNKQNVKQRRTMLSSWACHPHTSVTVMNWAQLAGVLSLSIPVSRRSATDRCFTTMSAEGLRRLFDVDNITVQAKVGGTLNLFSCNTRLSDRFKSFSGSQRTRQARYSAHNGHRLIITQDKALDLVWDGLRHVAPTVSRGTGLLIVRLARTNQLPFEASIERVLNVLPSARYSTSQVYLFLSGCTATQIVLWLRCMSCSCCLCTRPLRPSSLMSVRTRIKIHPTPSSLQWLTDQVLGLPSFP